MKLAILADIHANLEALEACLAHAQRQGARTHAFLGDLVGYGADPHACLAVVRRLAEQGAIVVRGNHDEAALGGLCADLHPAAREAAIWTRRQLTADARAFLESLPLQVMQGDSLFVHASAANPAAWAYVTGAPAALRCLRATTAQVVWAGHVHVPMLYFSRQDGVGVFSPQPAAPVPLLPGRRWLALAGSVGQPRDGNPAAAYLLFDTATETMTSFRVPYDWMGAAAKIRAAGLPETFAARLEHGE